jgi:hypothetical protein
MSVPNANLVTEKKKVIIFERGSAYCISLSLTYQIRKANSLGTAGTCY